MMSVSDASSSEAASLAPGSGCLPYLSPLASSADTKRLQTQATISALPGTTIPLFMRSRSGTAPRRPYRTLGQILPTLEVAEFSAGKSVAPADRWRYQAAYR